MGMLESRKVSLETAQSCLDWAAGNRSDSRFMASSGEARQAEVSPKVGGRGSHTMQRTGRQKPIPADISRGCTPLVATNRQPTDSQLHATCTQRKAGSNSPGLQRGWHFHAYKVPIWLLLERLPTLPDRSSPRGGLLAHRSKDRNLIRLRRELGSHELAE